MQKITFLPLDTSTPPLFQGIQRKYPRAFVTHFGIAYYSSFHRSTSGTGIPKGAIAGIVVGVFLGVVVFPALAFVFWRHRRRKRKQGDFTFIEPSIHKGYDITEVIDIQRSGQSQQRKSPAQSPVSEVSLDLVPVTIPQMTYPYPRPKPSPPTFPRSPTISSPSSPAKHLRDANSRGVIHSPEAEDQYLGVLVRNPFQVDFGNTPSPGLNRRSSVPKPAGPRPQSYRASTDDRRISVFMPPAQIVTDPSPTKGKEPQEAQEPPEPEMQQADGGRRMASHSFLDMNTSGVLSTRDGSRQSQGSIRPVSHMNVDSPRHSEITRTNSIQSHRYSDGRRESENSKPLSLSAVIRQPSTLKYRSSTGPHPYSPYSTAHQPLRHRTEGGVSPTDSMPMTTSEVSEIQFRDPREVSEPSTSLRRSASFSQPPIQPHPMKATAMTSPIYQKLFGTKQGDAPPDGLLAKKRPLHRKSLSAITFSPPQA
jgi:hypothetical protein